MQKCIITCNRLYRSKQIIIISSLFQNLFPSPRSPNLITRSIQQASSKTISNADDELDPRFINSKFPCLRPTPLEPHYNKSLIEALKVIRKSRELSGNVKSESSYRDAIAALKSYPRDIKSGKEAIKIACIGDKIRHHIQTFLETDNIPEVEETLKDPKFQTLCLFTQLAVRKQMNGIIKGIEQ
ncbi:15678_t:CDS:2 [Entrophospora sp. SA101]|nr:15678_t:CDS:2 [Entrophospora sp. SA101]